MLLHIFPLFRLAGKFGVLLVPGLIVSFSILKLSFFAIYSSVLLFSFTQTFWFYCDFYKIS